MQRINEIKNEYINLLNSGFFWELCPQLSGDWNEDKEAFTEIIKDIRGYLNNRRYISWK